MSNPNNRLRIERGQAMLAWYDDEFSDDEDGPHFQDMIADICHALKTRKEDPAMIVRMGLAHFTEEEHGTD